MEGETDHALGQTQQPEITDAQIDRNRDFDPSRPGPACRGTDEDERQISEIHAPDIAQIRIAWVEQRRHATVDRALRLHLRTMHRNAWSRRFASRSSRTVGTRQ